MELNTTLPPVSIIEKRRSGNVNQRMVKESEKRSALC